DNGDTGTDQQHLTLKTKGCKMEGESGQKHPAKSQSHFHQLSIPLRHPALGRLLTIPAMNVYFST
ncbi:MAG: hypothetical protein K6B44_04580, partial [Lachnospiraceae bacterium]|nr:hypothetical protein [Lachnospiraceae bacterium]